MVRPNSSPPSTQCFLKCFPLISRRCNCKARSQAQRHQHLNLRTHTQLVQKLCRQHQYKLTQSAMASSCCSWPKSTTQHSLRAMQFMSTVLERNVLNPSMMHATKPREDKSWRGQLANFLETRVSCLGSWLCRGVFDLWSTFPPLVWCSTGVWLLAHLSCQCIPSIMNRKKQCENSPNRQTSRKTKKTSWKQKNVRENQKNKKRRENLNIKRKQ